MADLALSASLTVDILYPDDADIRSFVAGAAVVAGQPVYIDSYGKVEPASSANGFRGIALETKNAGQPVSVLRRGEFNGYDLSSVAFDAPIYLSDTAGKLADAASVGGANKGIVARVVSNSSIRTISTPAYQKVLWIDGYVG